jgi:putative hydrolase of the HAD superfamily
VVVDYGGVISEYQHPSAVAELAGTASRIGGEDPALVTARYWEHRLAYDRGDLDEAAYWSLVTGSPVTADDPAVARLVALDVDSWARTRPRSLAALRDLAGRGHPMALLSNTPRPHATWMLEQPWAALFAVHVFSHRLRVVKPDAAIFRHTLDALGCRPDQAVFVDDRAENVAGARGVGMAAVHFEGEHSWDEVRCLVDGGARGESCQ